MIASTTKLLFIVLSLAVAFSAKGQSPTPLIVQSASTISTAAAPPVAAVQNPPSAEAAITLLEQMKAANDEILSKQKAALERLAEMRAAAEELKAFVARG